MTPFKVIQVINGDTIKVAPNFQWTAPTGQNIAGDTLRVLGYILPVKQTYRYNYAKQKLEKLLLNKNIVLKNAQLINENNIQQTACEILVDNVDVAFYFPEYRVR